MKLFLIIILFHFTINAQNLHTLTSNYVLESNNVFVFTPKEYNENNNYPLIYLLHGWTGNYKQWSEIVNLQQYADNYKMIIVCPDGYSNSWYVNSPIRPNMKFQTFFFENLVPFIHNNYNVDENNIFITGLSMGGHGAFLLLISNPDYFKGAGSTSGILDITEFPDKWEMSETLGSFNSYPENWIRNSVLFQIEKIYGLNKKLIVDCGIEDFAFRNNLKFKAYCDEKGINIYSIFMSGKHERSYWAKSIKFHFDFFSKSIKE